MARPIKENKKEYTRLCASIDSKTASVLNEFSEEVGISKTLVIEKALKCYIAYYRNTGMLMKVSENTEEKGK